MKKRKKKHKIDSGQAFGAVDCLTRNSDAGAAKAYSIIGEIMRMWNIEIGSEGDVPDVTMGGPEVMDESHNACTECFGMGRIPMDDIQAGATGECPRCQGDKFEPRPESDEIIEGLSPGEWEVGGSPYLVGNAVYCTIYDGQGDIIAKKVPEIDAKLIAGSKRLLETIDAFAIESGLNTKTWGRPSWNAVAYAMRAMGVVFPEK